MKCPTKMTFRLLTKGIKVGLELARTTVHSIKLAMASVKALDIIS